MGAAARGPVGVGALAGGARLRADPAARHGGQPRRQRGAAHAAGLPAAHRRLRGAARPAGPGRHQRPGRAPALRHRLHPPAGGAGARAGGRRRRRVAEGTGLARVLLPGAGQFPAGRPRRELPPRIRPHRVGAGRAGGCALRRLVRRPHRLPAGGRGDAAARRHRLHAQPPAHGRRELPVQGPGRRLAPRRAMVRAQAGRLRARLQQRQLAVDRFLRLRRPALVPRLQSGHAKREVRSRGREFIARWLPQLAALPLALRHAP